MYKKYDFGITVYLTASKFLAYAILILGATFSFVYKNPEVFMFSAGIAAGLHGLKSFTDNQIEKTKINKGVESTSKTSSTITTETKQSPPTVEQQPAKPQSEIG